MLRAAQSYAESNLQTAIPVVKLVASSVDDAGRNSSYFLHDTNEFAWLKNVARRCIHAGVCAVLKQKAASQHFASKKDVLKTIFAFLPLSEQLRLQRASRLIHDQIVPHTSEKQMKTTFALAKPSCRQCRCSNADSLQ